MKLKIVTDGTTQGTRVLNADTGEPVLNTKKVIIVFDGTKPPSVEIHLFDCSVDLVGDREGLTYEGYAETVFKGEAKYK